MEVSAITLESLEGTWTSVDPAESFAYFPVLLESGDVCNNVVKQVCTVNNCISGLGKLRDNYCLVFQVKYIFRYSEAGEILSVMASFLLGAIKSIMVPIQQEFQITFLQVPQESLSLLCLKNVNNIIYSVQQVMLCLFFNRRSQAHQG